MKQTPNLNLKLPDYNDTADIAVLNENMVALDTEIGDTISLKTTNKTVVGAINENKTSLTKMATDMESVKQSGVDAKQKVVTAINSKKTVPDITTAATWDTVATSINNIKEGSGNAQPGDVRAGKTFTNIVGEETGTIPVNPGLLAGTAHIPSPLVSVGPYSGDGVQRLYMRPGLANGTQIVEGDVWFMAPVAQLLPENLTETTNILGIQGNIPVKLTESFAAACHAYPPGVGNKNILLNVPRGYYENTWVGFAEPNLVPENVKKGVAIGSNGRFVGTYEGGKIPGYLRGEYKYFDFGTGFLHAYANIAIKDHFLYVLGGQKSGTMPSIEVIIYNLKTLSKVSSHNIATQRYDHGGATLNDIMYAMYGKYDEANFHASCQSFDMNTKTSKYLSTSPNAGNGKCYLATCAYNKLVYNCGGRIPGGQYVAILECFNPATDTWTTLSPALQTVSQPALCGANGELYLALTNNRTYHIYNIVTNTWREGGTIADSNTIDPSLACVDDVLYLNAHINYEVATYSLDTKTSSPVWTKITTNPIYHATYGCTASDTSSYYILAGEAGSTQLYGYIP